MNLSTGPIWRAVALAAVIVFLTAPLSAQRGKWWQNERFGRELALTEAQSARLEEIFQEHQPMLRTRMRALERVQAVFDQLIETGDDNAVMKQADAVEAARAELSKARTRMLLGMRRSLTADQWAQFTALSQKSRERSGHRAPPADRR